VIPPTVRGLLVGRFQPFHAGHLGLVRKIRSDAPSEELLLAIGSAEQSFTAENPFTASERYEMISLALAEAGIGRVVAVPVPDIHRHSLWVGYLEGLLPSFERVYTNNPLTRLLFEKAGYSVESPAWIDRAEFEGRRIRARLAEGAPLGRSVPPSVAAYLESIGAAARLKLLMARTGPAGSLPT